MPRRDKSSYSGKQQRKAEHIEQGYEKKGVPEREAERRAWATVNKQDGGGERSGSGRRKPAGAKATARRSSAKRAATTRRAGRSPSRSRARSR